MKKIKLKFRNEFDKFAFYDRCWCRGYDYPQCESCDRNPRLYENWQPPGCYTGFGFTEETRKQAEAGECQMYTGICISECEFEPDEE